MPPTSKHEESILRSLRRIMRAIDLHSRQLESHYGLTGPQLVALRAIATAGKLTPGELARAVDLSQATVTGIVDRLVRRQYVSRRRDDKDRRRVLLRVLPAGADVIASAPSPLQTQFAHELEKLPVENQVVIATMLEQIVRMMGAEELEVAAILATGEPEEGHDGGHDLGDAELLEPDESGPSLAIVSDE